MKKKQKIKWVERKIIIMLEVELMLSKNLSSDMYLSALLLHVGFHVAYPGLIPVQQTSVRHNNFKH